MYIIPIKIMDTENVGFVYCCESGRSINRIRTFTSDKFVSHSLPFESLHGSRKPNNMKHVSDWLDDIISTFEFLEYSFSLEYNEYNDVELTKNKFKKLRNRAIRLNPVAKKIASKSNVAKRSKLKTNCKKLLPNIDKNKLDDSIKVVYEIIRNIIAHRLMFKTFVGVHVFSHISTGLHKEYVRIVKKYKGMDVGGETGGIIKDDFYINFQDRELRISFHRPELVAITEWAVAFLQEEVFPELFRQLDLEYVNIYDWKNSCIRNL